MLVGGCMLSECVLYIELSLIPAMHIIRSVLISDFVFCLQISYLLIR